MERPLDYLKRCANHDWLINQNNHHFFLLAEQLYLELTQLLQQGFPPKIILVERDPVRFLAGFLAACAAGCPVFLCNPNWVKQEWQQVFELVKPDLILGYGDWGLAIRNYYPTPDSVQIWQSPLIMIPTGGSSGKIRFAMHSWETLTASVQGFQKYFQVNQINSCCVLPLYHVSGLMQFLRSLTTNGQFVVLPFKQLAAGEICDIPPAKFFISLVPTQLQRLLQNSILANWLSDFKTVLLGGAPAWKQLLEQARCYKIPLSLTYGMTETASQIATLKPEDFLRGKVSCGRVLPHARISICNATGQILDINQIGNITIQAESLAFGYYPELFKDRHGFKLDDLGYFDDQGYLNIVGRSSNKIITGGENVFPHEVETAIRETQMVIDVCVIGLPEQDWGQVVTAIYVPNNSSVTTAAIQDAIADKLSKFKQPKHWISLPQLPRNPQGKINYTHLNKIAQELLHNSAK